MLRIEKDFQRLDDRVPALVDNINSRMRSETLSSALTGEVGQSCISVS
jgi:hypothetical protein